MNLDIQDVSPDDPTVTSSWGGWVSGQARPGNGQDLRIDLDFTPDGASALFVRMDMDSDGSGTWREVWSWDRDSFPDPANYPAHAKEWEFTASELPSSGSFSFHYAAKLCTFIRLRAKVTGGTSPQLSAQIVADNEESRG